MIGGSGFIGSHLVDVFRKHRLEVTVFDRRREKFRLPISGLDLCKGRWEIAAC